MSKLAGRRVPRSSQPCSCLESLVRTLAGPKQLSIPISLLDCFNLLPNCSLCDRETITKYRFVVRVLTAGTAIIQLEYFRLMESH